MNVAGILLWTGSGAVLLFVLMAVDSLFTRYKDIEEIKQGNMAVTTRFVMKLFAQGYILSRSILTSNNLLEALVVSIVSFIILLALELLIRLIFAKGMQLNLDEGTKQGKIGYGLIAGTLHIVGALVIAACL
jgi:uncharacterized membrane protein YjfL (UPF0719 family)